MRQRSPTGGVLPLACVHSCVIPAEFRTAAAALLGKEGDELANTFGIDGIQNAALLSPRTKEASTFELRKVGGHGRGGHTYLCGNVPGGQSMRGVAHQEPEDFETVFLRQGAEGLNGSFFFHISMIKKITKYCKSTADFCAGELRHDLETVMQECWASRGCAVRADTLP
jgi:hypothetical protein